MKQKSYMKFEHYLAKNRSPVTGLQYKRFVLKVTEELLNRIWNKIQVLDINTVMEMVDNQVKNETTSVEQATAIKSELNGIHKFAIVTNFDQTSISNLLDVDVRSGGVNIPCKQIAYSPVVVQTAEPVNDADVIAMLDKQGK